MKLHLRSEFIIGSVLLLAMLVIGTINPAFWHLDNIFNLLRNNIVIGIMAMGVLLILISGGIDVSFPAFAVASAYITIKLVVFWQLPGVLLPILMSIIFGALFGLINAFFVAKFKMIPLIVTLGTGGMVRGFLLGFVGTSMININKMPRPLIDLSKLEIFSGLNADGTHYGLTVLVLFYVFTALAIHFLLKYTMLGRSIYALGGDPVSAERAGFNIPGIQTFIYCLAGALAGFAGILHNSLIWLSNPRDMMGFELDVIAAVVLGGASIFGGKGTVLGTVLGVFMLVLVKNSLIIMKVDTTWQRVVVGVIILAATAITAYRDKKTNA
ncbi:MAG: ABC transporter permease [Desulfotalea sp.]|nr:MAG: ABC transporter permease [Desulfotalea sp.]